MVVFTCEACNESLKKNKVDAHLFRCRRARHVTCIDCQRDFDRESYKAHTSCITEAEKYSGPGYTPKASANKGARKQDGWFQRVQSAIDSCGGGTGNQQLARVLLKVRESANVPRKQGKFVNFCRNSMKWASQGLIQQAWDLLAQGAQTDGAESAAGQDKGKLKEDQVEAAETSAEPARKKMKKREEAGIDDAVDAAEESLGTGESEKKKKKKSKDEEAGIDEAAEESLGTGESEKKNKKKRKYKEAGIDEAADAAERSLGTGESSKVKTCSELEETFHGEPVDAANESLEATESAKKKKKKKKEQKKREEAGNDEAPEPVASTEGSLDTEESSAKKRKSREQNGDDDTAAAQGSLGAVESIEMKEKKHKRKHREIPDGDANEAEAAMVVPDDAESKSKKHKKKRKPHQQEMGEPPAAGDAIAVS